MVGWKEGLIRMILKEITVRSRRMLLRDKTRSRLLRRIQTKEGRSIKLYNLNLKTQESS
jgi:hypothetical protein